MSNITIISNTSAGASFTSTQIGVRFYNHNSTPYTLTPENSRVCILLSR